MRALTNGEVFNKLRELADGKNQRTVPGHIRDQILFAVISDIHTKIGEIDAKVRRIWPVYQVLALIGGAAVTLISAAISGLVVAWAIRVFGPG